MIQDIETALREADLDRDRLRHMLAAYDPSEARPASKITPRGSDRPVYGLVECPLSTSLQTGFIGTWNSRHPTHSQLRITTEASAWMCSQATHKLRNCGWQPHPTMVAVRPGSRAISQTWRHGRCGF